MSHVDMKVVLLGKEYGGKTSLVERYLYDRFNGELPYQNTIGAAYGAKQVIVNNKRITLGIWDTAGSERYEAMSRIYYRGAGAAIVCFDLTEDNSFQRAKFWVKELNKYEENTGKTLSRGQKLKCKIYLCGTKKDLINDKLAIRAVQYHITVSYADEIEAQLFETSSKTAEGVAELFQKVAEDYVESIGGHKDSIANSQFKLEEPLPKDRGCCS